jgi:hypothetical protein
MQQLRTELESLNDLANGVMLPGAKADQNATGAYHPRLDNDLYNDTVVNELLGVTSAEKARVFCVILESDYKKMITRGLDPEMGTKWNVNEGL